jgi:hypothetical protein
MLSLQKQSKFIKKTITLPNGSLALVVFELTEVNGKIIAKAVCGKILGQENSSVECSEVLALPVYFESKSVEPIVSPFFADVINLVKDLSFVVSQPSRAPNL